jgi:hypothetical protein
MEHPSAKIEQPEDYPVMHCFSYKKIINKLIPKHKKYKSFEQEFCQRISKGSYNLFYIDVFIFNLKLQTQLLLF